MNEILDLNIDTDMRYSLSDDDDDDDDNEINCFSSEDIVASARQDVISNSLIETGTINGMAAATALATARKSKLFKFEVDPAVRRRQQTRLMRKLRQTLNELCLRCGQQAVVVSVLPGKVNNSFRVFGTHPLDQAIRACQQPIVREYEKDLQSKLETKTTHHQDQQFELPNLVIDGIPTSIDQMNQAQLRMFIPEMLKYATGRGKPGWGKESFRPVWWPVDVPWANVRRDVRDEEIKLKVPWSQALRQIVKNCYRYHNRDDLLNGISLDDQQNLEQQINIQQLSCHRFKLPSSSPATSASTINTDQQISMPPTFVHTVHNADGTVALVQVESGQTIATISPDTIGNAMATFTNHPHQDSSSELNLQQLGDEDDGGAWTISAATNPHHHTIDTDSYDVIEGEQQLMSGDHIETSDGAAGSNDDEDAVGATHRSDDTESVMGLPSLGFYQPKFEDDDDEPPTSVVVGEVKSDVDDNDDFQLDTRHHKPSLHHKNKKIWPLTNNNRRRATLKPATNRRYRRYQPRYARRHDEMDRPDEIDVSNYHSASTTTATPGGDSGAIDLSDNYEVIIDVQDVEEGDELIDDDDDVVI